MKKKIIREIIDTGKFLFEAGVVEYFSGNLSIKDAKGNIFITRSGSPLPLLKPQDIIKIPHNGIPLREELKNLFPTKKGKLFAGKPSSEFIVHREIYRKTKHHAVAHAHPPSVVKLAFTLGGDFYIPRDSEAKLLLGKVPIVKVEKPSASHELAEVVSENLKRYSCVIVYSHGVFCASRTLKEAAGLITALEFSTKVFK